MYAIIPVPMMRCCKCEHDTYKYECPKCHHRLCSSCHEVKRRKSKKQVANIQVNKIMREMGYGKGTKGS